MFVFYSVANVGDFRSFKGYGAGAGWPEIQKFVKKYISHFRSNEMHFRNYLGRGFNIPEYKGKKFFDPKSLVGSYASSETQGQRVGARESLNKRKNMAQKKSKERREEPLGTMSYQTSSKRSPPFWLMIGARKLVFFWHQSEARTAATV